MSLEGKRLLVANRGEIATRIFRAATELNMNTIALYSYEDRFSVHRFKADEAYRVGIKNDPLGAYLNWDEIITLALDKKIDAIHPGYGLLSENSEFAKACEDAGIIFCGPGHKILDYFGDKLKSKELADIAKVDTIPGYNGSLENLEKVKLEAKKMGFPVMLKALHGGGGKGIRKIDNIKSLDLEFERAQSEAKKSFGHSGVYIEKNIANAKHIEVQIAGDKKGNIYHFFERDCSIQRRNQKIVELAPAIASQKVKKKLREDALKIAKSINYVGVGTVEFLVDENENTYFLEVNPRIQVEHTITELITQYDLVQISILTSFGHSLKDKIIGITKQDDIKCFGYAIQCRITTEDPTKDFLPDTGEILAYRPPQGFGVRLDEGMGTTGGVVTPHYDSLLVKVSTHYQNFPGAIAKMRRALKEFRIRGVKNNIPLLLNIVEHKNFLQGDFNTNFLEIHKEVFSFPQPRDRATKILKFLSEVKINNTHNLTQKEFLGSRNVPVLPNLNPDFIPKESAKKIFDQEGTQGLINWIKKEKSLLLTDTTMRDAQQSLFATRLRNHDIFNAASYYNNNCTDLFSMEVWGGATFDVCLRFLKEDPWERLSKLREKIPNILLQMLFRGANAVGYKNYPKWVLRDFIKHSFESGIDIFRIFDCLNNTDQLSFSMEEAKKRGAIVEACICYTANQDKYTLDYYVNFAKELKKMGSDILCIKDMAGLLRPQFASNLVRALKDETDLPVHLHTHATAGSSVAMILKAYDSGLDIVDGSISSMSGLTSQPSLNSIVACLEETKQKSKLQLKNLDELSPYWEGVRNLYQAFDPGVKSTTTRVYEHEIPGGQYSNLFNQARCLGVSLDDFYDLTTRYKEVNQLLGDIIKVTPSSKVVGDFALLLQKNNLTGEEYIKNSPDLDYPDSVISFFNGEMGIPYGGFPEEIKKRMPVSNKVKEEFSTKDNFENTKKELEEQIDFTPSDTLVMSYKLYPKVCLDYLSHKKMYGDLSSLPTVSFFYGLNIGEEIEIDISPGKTLIIGLVNISDKDSKGFRKIFYRLNGFPRKIEIFDNRSVVLSTRKKADPLNKNHVGASMPGKIVKISRKAGDKVKKGDPLLVTESMKMEYIIVAKNSGTLKEYLVNENDEIDSGDLLIVFNE